MDISSDPTVLDPNFLTIADNVEYLEGGQRAKRLGTLQYSASSSSAGTFQTSSPGPVLVTSSTNVRAFKDFWSYGGTSTPSLTPTQTLIAVAGASIFRSTGGGNWTKVSVSSSFGANGNLQTNILQAGDYAVITDGVTAPVAYQVSSTTLVTPSTGANWPIFESGTYHLNRMWMSGLNTNPNTTSTSLAGAPPSTVAFTAANNIFDSTGADTGSFTVASGDGDRVIGISDTFYGSIYIFKGPQYGSVYQLSGNTPSAFALSKVAHGAPLNSFKALLSTPTDVYWLSNYGAHSLETTVKFGNVEQAFLSLPIQALFRSQIIKRSDLANAAGFWNPTRNIIGWIVTPNGFAGQGSRSWVLVYNYALSDPKPGGKKFWSIWKLSGFGGVSVGMALNPTGGFQPTHIGEPHLYIGSDQGLVYQADYANLDDDGLAYTATIQTPTLTRFKTDTAAIPETQEKSFIGVVTYFNPAGNASTANLTVIIDGRTQNRSISLSQGGDTLG